MAREVHGVLVLVRYARGARGVWVWVCVGVVGGGGRFLGVWEKLRGAVAEEGTEHHQRTFT